MISLFPHQQEALQETKDFDNIAVYHDMGLGKTFTGSEMMKRFGCKVNLIVCQKSKVQDWVEHFTDNYQMQVFDLTNKKQLGEYHGLSQGQRFFIVGVINYELAWRRKELLDLYDFTLMLDESSLIQNQKAKQTKFILKMKPAHVILLSGTPVGGKYENLWTQVHLLGWKISEDLYNRQYVNWTTIDSGGFQHKIVDKEDPYKNIDRLKSKMREHGAIFKKTEECYELPEQVFTHIRLKAPKEYWKFQKDCIVTIEGQELVGDTSLTKLLYSRQICSQFKTDIWVGFNNHHYDDYILKGILCDMNPKEINDHIIIKEKAGWTFSNLFRSIPLLSYDVFQAKIDRGLKFFEGSLGNMVKESSIPFDIPRKLTEEELQETVKYCRHDVEQTVEVFMQRKADFDAIMSLIKMFPEVLSIRDIGLTKAQISAKILECEKVRRNDEFDLFVLPCIQIG